MKFTARMTTLLRSVPTAVTVVFCLAVIVMNFLSRITLVSLPWLALNAGILVSWVAFLFMDVITKHYGAWAGNLLSTSPSARICSAALSASSSARSGAIPRST